MKTPEKRREKKNYSKKAAAILLTAFSVLSCILAAIGAVLLKTVFKDSDVFKEFVNDHYILSVIAMILICATQVVVALIPGEVVEIASGYAFGTFPGTLICLIGITLGSAIVLILAKRYGRRVIDALCPPEKLEMIPIIHEEKKLNTLTAILFLIPGTPKDLLTYAVGVTDMKIPTYLMIATVARIPSILMSTIGGDALGENRFSHAIIAFIVSAVLSLTGYLIYLHISKKKRENK